MEAQRATFQGRTSPQLVATVSGLRPRAARRLNALAHTPATARRGAFLTVGFCRWEKPTVNQSIIDRGYQVALRIDRVRIPADARARI